MKRHGTEDGRVYAFSNIFWRIQVGKRIGTDGDKRKSRRRYYSQD